MRALRPPSRLIALVIGFVLAAPAVAAAQGTPTPMTGMDMSGPGYPAHIHEGACGQLGAVAYDLGNLLPPIQNMAAAGSGTPMSGMTMNGNGTPTSGAARRMTTNPAVAQVTVTVPVPLAALEQAPHAINVHQSMAAIGAYVACGDIAGATAHGALTIALAELNASGLAGVAVLTDHGGQTTTVQVTLFTVTPVSATPMAMS